MKIFSQFLSLSLLLICSCQSDSSTQAGNTNTASTTPVTIDAQRQETVLRHDTTNAVQEEVVKKPSANALNDFKAFFHTFEQAIQQQDAAAFNQFISPQHGLYIIDTPGAMPQFHYITDITTFKRADVGQRPFFTIRETFKKCNLQTVETLPKVNCEGDAEPFEKQGCFVASGAAFQKNEAYKYASLSAQQEQTVAQTQLLVSKTVLHTASGFKFHFGQINGQWRVLFIDLMVPCSA